MGKMLDAGFWIKFWILEFGVWSLKTAVGLWLFAFS
jgi:hypothetical protein